MKEILGGATKYEILSVTMADEEKFPFQIV